MKSRLLMCFTACPPGKKPKDRLISHADLLSEWMLRDFT
jgi:hypothetical protein